MAETVEELSYSLVREFLSRKVSHAIVNEKVLKYFSLSGY